MACDAAPGGNTGAAGRTWRHGSRVQVGPEHISARVRKPATRCAPQAGMAPRAPRGTGSAASRPSAQAPSRTPTTAAAMSPVNAERPGPITVRGFYAARQRERKGCSAHVHVVAVALGVHVGAGREVDPDPGAVLLRGE